jgi:hypothetical protein
MLVGEPGIGKSALCEQLVNFVDQHGGLPLVGHCYPEGSARLPYQPFVEALENGVFLRWWLASAHRRAGKRQAVSVLHEAIEDGICQRGVTSSQGRMPGFD